jgi:hypothetical protein
MSDSIKEGFWKGFGEDANLPMPVANKEPWAGQDQFLKELIQIEGNLLELYQAYVEAYNSGLFLSRTLRAPPQVQSYRGFSQCRICGKSNGSREFDYGGYVWPSGFRHYIEAHNVKPSDGFIKMISENSKRG